jgi:hypothetical protein
VTLAVTHSKTLVAPDSGTDDKVYGSDYVSPSSHTLTGTADVTQGGTGLTSGTAGGLLYFATTNTIADTGNYPTNAVLVGAGVGAPPSYIPTPNDATKFLNGAAAFAAVTAANVGLGNVTNDAQTQAAIVPNTAPSAGQILVGNAGGTAYAPVSMSSDATLASTGALTLATSGVSAATYGDASHVAQVVVDAKGRITSASSVAISVTTSTDIVFADSPCQDFDLTAGGGGGAVTILSKSITGITAGDTIILDAWYWVFNNSTASRSYTPHITLGGTCDPNSTGNTYAQTNSAVNRLAFHLQLVFSVHTTGLTNSVMNSTAGTVTGAGVLNSLTTAPSSHCYQTTGSDLTGTQTLLWTVTSSATTATQTLTLNSYTIRKVSQK